VIAAVKRIKAHGIDRARRPQSQRVHVPATPADDRRVVGGGHDGLIGSPNGPRCAVWKLFGLDETAEIDVVRHLRAGELPGVAERQPFLWIFLLPAISDDLAKQAVIVADAVAVGRNS
jgi:hypothetical protein